MNFGMIGGDRRQAVLAELLREEGHAVSTYGLEAEEPSLQETAAAEVVVLPLPFCRPEGMLNCGKAPLPVEELFDCFRQNQLLLGGQISSREMEQARMRGLRLLDYFKREELTVANAAATAEAAIQVAMEHSERTLLGMNCLVLGFGRIGKLLSHRLAGLGAHVAATARKPGDLAWIEAYGWTALDTKRLDGQLGWFDMVFNTIPAPVLDEALLRQLPKECLCIDLASVQGIDEAAADTLGLKTIWARALPGRMVPRSAAAIIKNAIYHIIEEDSLR